MFNKNRRRESRANKISSLKELSVVENLNQIEMENKEGAGAGGRGGLIYGNGGSGGNGGNGGLIYGHGGNGGNGGAR